MINQAVKQLIQAIATFAREKDAYLNKTKLLKLLYLFDVEFYRLHRSIFTGFSWKFYHLGPWTAEFDVILEDLERSGELIPRQSSNPEFESICYLPGIDIDTDALFQNLRDGSALNKVLNLWVERPTGEILDHVYFHTEPMEQGVRNTPLDFTVISADPPARYTRPSSNTTPQTIAGMRRAFKQRQSQLRKQGDSVLTPPRYDNEFFQGMTQLEETST